MTTFIEYELEDGTTILIEATESEGGMVPVAARDGKPIIKKAGKKFAEALDSVKAQAQAIQGKLHELKADEVEVKFSLTTTGELGNFAVGKVGIEANYEITLKWKNE